MPGGRKGYSFPINRLPDTSKIAIARGYELPIKWKHAREIANAIMERKMKLNDAIAYLEDVIEMKRAVPFKRYKGNVGHRKGMHEFRWKSGRYPVKAAKYILDVLKNVRNNARNKNLNEEQLQRIWFATHKRRKIRQRPDRRGPGIFRGIKVKRGTNVEIVVMEVPSEEKGVPEEEKVSMEEMISEVEEKPIEETELTEGEVFEESEAEESISEEEEKLVEELEAESEIEKEETEEE